MFDTFSMIREILDSDVTIIEDQERKRPVNSEVLRLWGDNSLLKKLTGFTPHFSIKTGLEITCEWFSKKENLKNYKPGIYNV